MMNRFAEFYVRARNWVDQRPKTEPIMTGKIKLSSSMEVFPDHRRCHFRLLIPYCLGILTGVILADSWDFTLHEFSASLQNAPPFLSSLSVHFLSIIPNLIPHVLFPPPSVHHEIYSIFPSHVDPSIPS